MGSRRALLIGASDYDAPGISSLPFVPTDMAALREALEHRGYQVTLAVPPRQVGINFVNGAMGRFLRTAGLGDRLLVCLSGHGVHAEGQDYFVPEDADPELEPFEKGCVAIDWMSHLQQSLADHIVILVDACREGIARDTKALNGITGWSRRRSRFESKRKIAYVYACSPGQMARFVTPGEKVRDGADCGTRPGESFSLFSRAVRDVLLHHPDALDLRGFREHVQDRIEHLHRAYGKTTDLQELRIVLHAGGELEDFPVAGPAPAADHQEEDSGRESEESAPPPSDPEPPRTDDPGLRLARAQYRFQLHGEEEPLFDFAADGPARDVMQLASVVPDPVAERIWTACARRRSGPGLHELRRLLARTGHEALERALLDDALRHRPPHEVIEGLDPDDVREILEHLTGSLDSAALVELLESLHRHGRDSAAGLLLYHAVRRPFDQLPSLILALRRTGLIRPAEQVLAHLGRQCAPVDLPALLAALEETGRRSDRRRVLDALTAHRPATDLVQVLAELRAAGRETDVQDVPARVVATGPYAVSRLTLTLFRHEAVTDAALLLSTAAQGLPVRDLAQLVGTWGEEGPEGVPAQLLLMDGVVRLRGFTDLVQLVRALGAAWLDTEARTLLGLWTRYRPPSELPALIETLAQSGHHAEATHVLAAVATRGLPETVAETYTALRGAGTDTSAVRLVRLVVDRRPDETLAMALRALRKAGAGAVLRAVVSAAVTDAYRSVLELVPLLWGLSHAEAVDVVREIVWQRPVADLPVVLRALSARSGPGPEDAWRDHLRQEALRNLSLPDLAELVLTLQASGTVKEWQELLRSAADELSAEKLGKLVAALYGGETSEAASWLRNRLATTLSGPDLAALVSTLQGMGHASQAETVLALVGEQRRTDVVASLMEELVTWGRPATAETLAGIAVARRPLEEALGLLTELIDSGRDAVSQRMLVHMATASSPLTVEAVLVLGELDRSDVVQRLLNVWAVRTTPRGLMELVGGLRGAGLGSAAEMAVEAVGVGHEPVGLAEFLRQASGIPHRDRIRIMSTVARNRTSEDLLELVQGCPNAVLVEWVLRGLGAFGTVPVLAETLGVLDADGSSGRAETVLHAMFEHNRREDLVTLLRCKPHLFTAHRATLQDFGPIALISWARTLRETGMDVLASQVAADAVARNDEELLQILKAAHEGGWGDDAQALLEETVRSGGMTKLVYMIHSQASATALYKLIDRVPLVLRALDPSVSAKVRSGPMTNCPATELIPALVASIVAAGEPDEEVLVSFLTLRTPLDVGRLLGELHRAGADRQAEAVLKILVRRVKPDETAILVKAWGGARADAAIDALLKTAAATLPHPARLIASLHRLASPAHADRLVHLVVEHGPYAQLPLHASELDDSGLHAKALHVIKAYIDRCPDGALVAAVQLFDRPALRRWRPLLATHIAVEREAPVLHHVLTHLCEKDESDAALELLAAVRRYLPAEESAGIVRALTESGHYPRPRPEPVAAPPPPTPRSKSPFSRFRRAR